MARMRGTVRERGDEREAYRKRERERERERESETTDGRCQDFFAFVCFTVSLTRESEAS